MDQWSNKVAIVTAANSKIGAEICRELCSHQLTVVGLTPHIDQLNALGEEIRETNEDAQFHAIQCDLVNEEEIQSAVEYVCSEFGGVDVLINSPGCAESAGLLFLEEDGIEAAENVIRTNILGMLSIAKKAYQSMVERETGGYLINISATADRSDAATSKGHSSIFAASRAAVDAFTSELGKELCLLDRPKIRVSNVRLDGGEGGAAFTVDEGRSIGPKDVADTVLYCLSTPAHVQIRDIQLGAVGGAF